MKAGITTFGCDSGKSGVSLYVIRLLEQFAVMQDSETEFEAILYEDELPIWLGNNGAITPVIVGGGMRKPVLNVFWHQTALRGLARRRRYDVLFLPSANRRTPVAPPCPAAGTVHDFSQLHIPAKYDPARMFYQNTVLPWMIRQLTHVITISESSKRDIISHCKVPEDRITVIPHGVEHERYFPRDKAECAAAMAEKYGLRAPYVMYLARIEHPAKNHVRLIRAFDRLKDREGLPHQLVLVGSDWHGAEEVHRAANAARHAADIVFTGFAPIDDLPVLYCGGDLLAFPSLYEGFGFPILEAMACGLPVACSNVASMPEVAGGAGIPFDPLDEDAIEDSMGRLLTDEALRAECMERGLQRSREFTWPKAAGQTLDVLRAIARSS